MFAWIKKSLTRKKSSSFFLIKFLILILIFSCGEITPKQVEKNNTSTKTHQEIRQVISPKKEIPKPIVFDYDTSQWMELRYLDSTIIIDMRYATTDNFVKEKMYECGRCFLRPEVAQRVAEAHRILQKKGLGLKMLDCFRPRPIQQKLWDKFKDPRYVTPPSKGSMHNRGAAVDLTIVDKNGKQLDMGTTYDFFGKEAHHAYSHFPKKILANRKLLKATMKEVGLKSITTEWWHYSYQGKKYELSDMLWRCE